MSLDPAVERALAGKPGASVEERVEGPFGGSEFCDRAKRWWCLSIDRTVENERPQMVGVAIGVHEAEFCPVGEAEEADPGLAESLADPVHVVGSGDGIESD